MLNYIKIIFSFALLICSNLLLGYSQNIDKTVCIKYINSNVDFKFDDFSISESTLTFKRNMEGHGTIYSLIGTKFVTCVAGTSGNGWICIIQCNATYDPKTNGTISYNNARTARSKSFNSSEDAVYFLKCFHVLCPTAVCKQEIPW